MKRLEVYSESKIYSVQKTVETVFSKTIDYIIKFEFRRANSTDLFDCITQLECCQLNFATTQKSVVSSISEEIIANSCSTVEGSFLSHLLLAIRTLEADYLMLRVCSSLEPHNDSNNAGLYWWRQLKNPSPVIESSSNEVPKLHTSTTSAYQTHSAYGHSTRIDFGYHHITETIRDFTSKPHVIDNGDFRIKSVSHPLTDFEVIRDLAAQIFQLKEVAAVLLQIEMIKNKVPIKHQLYQIHETLIEGK